MGEAIRKCRALCRKRDTKLRFSQAGKVQVSDAWSVGSSPTSAISLIEADLTDPQGIRAYTASIKFSSNIVSIGKIAVPKTVVLRSSRSVAVKLNL